MKLTLGIVFFLMACTGLRITFSYLKEGAIEALEDDRYCDALRGLELTSIASDESKKMLGFLYAGAFCGDQDIDRAKRLYGSIYGNISTKMGEQFFYDAVEVSAADNRTGRNKRTLVLQALFAESAKIGFHPNIDDLERLNSGNLRDDYQASLESLKANRK